MLSRKPKEQKTPHQIYCDYVIAQGRKRRSMGGTRINAHPQVGVTRYSSIEVKKMFEKALTK